MTAAPATAPASATDRALRALVLVALAGGVALRAWQFASGAALNIAEIALARNLEARSLTRLVSEPLALGQLVMPGYLVLQKGVVAALGTGPYALRLVPLIASIAVLVAAWRLAVRATGSWGQLVAVAGAALSVPGIAYGLELKPFGGMDAAGALGVLWLAAWWLDAPAGGRRAALVAVGGVLLIASSQPAAFCAGGAAALMAYRAWRGGAATERAPLLLVALAWTAAGIAAWHAPTLQLAAGDAAKYEELYASAFVPRPWPVVPLVHWLWTEATRLAGMQLMFLPAPVVMAGAFGAGLASLLAARGRVGALVGAALAVMAAFSMAHVVPFGGVYLVFVVPLLFLGLGHLVDRVASLTPAGARALVGVAGAAVALASPAAALAANRPPYVLQDAPAVLAQVRARWQPGDTLYAFFGARPAMRFYGPVYGFQPGQYVQGACHLGNPRAYLAELDALRGQRRAWVFVVHDAGRDNARLLMLRYLDAIGTRLASVVVTRPPFPPAAVGAFAYLYDLGDTTRLARATVDSIAGPAPAVPPDERNCGWGPIAPEEP